VHEAGPARRGCARRIRRRTGPRHREGPLLRPHVGDRSGNLPCGSDPEYLAARLDQSLGIERGTPASAATDGAPRVARISSRPVPSPSREAGLQNSASKSGSPSLEALMSRSLHSTLSLWSSCCRRCRDGTPLTPRRRGCASKTYLVGLQQVGAQQEPFGCGSASARPAAGALAAAERPSPRSSQALERLAPHRRSTAQVPRPIVCSISLAAGRDACEPPRGCTNPRSRERHKVSVHLPRRASLLARLRRLALEPAGASLRTGRAYEAGNSTSAQRAGRVLHDNCCETGPRRAISLDSCSRN
jgi:hypothetical protein